MSLKPQEGPTARTAKAPIVISVASLLVAMCSLFLTVDQAKLNRKDKRLSVRPEVEMAILFQEDWNGWVIANNGLGPARVKWFEVTVDGVPKRDWLEVKAALPLPQGEFSHSSPIPNTMVRSGTRGALFGFKGRYGAIDVLKRNAGRVKMTLCYCSLMDECWISRTDAFARELDSCESAPPVQFALGDPI